MVDRPGTGLCRAKDAGFYQVTGQPSETAAEDRSDSRQDRFRQHGCGSSRRRLALSAAHRTEAADPRRYTAWLCGFSGLDVFYSGDTVVRFGNEMLSALKTATAVLKTRACRPIETLVTIENP
jgi:hypothetical protein